MKGLIGIIVIVWLLIGVLAAYQRHYFDSNNASVDCKRAGDTALTIISGPLNYVGVNPKIDCNVNAPQPSS